METRSDRELDCGYFLAIRKVLDFPGSLYKTSWAID